MSDPTWKLEASGRYVRDPSGNYESDAKYFFYMLDKGDVIMKEEICREEFDELIHSSKDTIESRRYVQK